ASSSARRRAVPGARTCSESSSGWRKASPAQPSARSAAAARPPTSGVVVGCSVVCCICAAHAGAATFSEIPLAQSPQGERGCAQYSPSRRSERRAGSSQAAEDDERVLRHALPDERRARLDLAVEPLRQRFRVLARVRPDEEVPEPAQDAVAFGLELVGKLFGVPARLELDADLPRCDSFLEQLLLGRRLGRLVVPPLLVVEPVLDGPDSG